MAGRSLFDWVVILFFVSHIPATMCVDGQALLGQYYPAPLKRMLAWYVDTYADPLMGDPQPWFVSIVLVEVLLQLPFFFVAAYAWIKRCEWIRTPVLIYAAHVATTLVPILGTLINPPATSHIQPTPSQRGALVAIYLPYLLVPLAILVRAASGPLFPGAGKGSKAGKTA